MNSTVKSARRVFEILEFFAIERAPQRAISIIRRLGYPPSSAAALLKSLTETGYLAFDRQSHTYFPTVRLLILGSRFHRLAAHESARLDKKHLGKKQKPRR